MFRGVLVLLRWSLRVDGRRLRTYLLRLLLVGLVFCFFAWAQMTSASFGAPGLRFFEAITQLNFVLITLAGVSFFATAITEEKEEGTLGLLRMAGINPLALLLGKSTTRLIGVLLVFWAQLPFVLLATILGGVTNHQIVATYSVLAAYVVLLANLALFASVSCKRSGSASGLMVILLLLFFVFPPAVRLGLAALIKRGSLTPQSGLAAVAGKLADLLADVSVFDRMRVILKTGFAESAVSFQVGSSLVASAVFFILSWLLFDVMTRGPETEGPPRGMSTASTRRSSRFATGRVWSAALVWKDYHFLTGGHKSLVARFILYGLSIAAIHWTCVLVMSPFRWKEFIRYVLSGLLIAVAVELSVSASRIFHEEAKWRTLQPLLLLPVSLLRIAYSKVAGCLLGLVPAVAYLVAVCSFSADAYEVLVEAVVMPATWLVIVQFVVFLHLTALLSLIVKWGALPLSVAILAVVESCSAPFFVVPIAMFQASTGSDLVSIAPLIYTGLLLAGILQYLIGQRLQGATTD